MSDDAPVQIDTRDMVALHATFGRALSDAGGQIASVSDGDTERARRLADYLGEVLWLLHAHHDGEDQLLYPLLAERVPDSQETFSRMDAQHVAVSSSIDTAGQAAAQFGSSAGLIDGQTAAGACAALLAVMTEHVTDEEEAVLPIAARVISPPEWGALPAHALLRYTGDRVWLPFGLAFEGMPGDIQESMLERLPPPVSAMWLGGGSDAFANEMAIIRGGTA
jgi:hemerythrin-like domain-containing protein